MQLLPTSDQALLYPSAADVLDWFRQDVETATEVRREILSEPYLIAEDVVSLLESSVPELSEREIDEMRRAGKLLALPDHGELLYPAFQFDPATSAPYPAIGKVSEYMDPTESPWGVVAWWKRPHEYLDRREPRELLSSHSEDELLVTAARVSRGERPPDAVSASA
jgi:hypothetical protein